MEFPISPLYLPYISPISPLYLHLEIALGVLVDLDEVGDLVRVRVRVRVRLGLGLV